MHILFHHNGILPVKKYGGIERILFWHMKELIKFGHQVTYIGPEGSDLNPWGIKTIIQKNLDSWYEQVPDNVELIHLFYNFKPPLDIPFLLTMEGNGRPKEEFPYNTVFVSQKHAELHNSSHFVHNGLDLSEYPFEDKTRGFEKFLFLAKGSWKVKNLKGVIQACRKTGKHLNIVGGRSWIPYPKIHSFGMLGGQEKLDVIKKSDALLFPVRWHEPFGIAIIEAMAMGLPVIGSSYGSLPELLQPGVGVACSDFNELLETLRSPADFKSPEEIREHIEKNFQIKHFTENHLGYYQRIICGEQLHEHFPSWKYENLATDLLDF